MADAAAESAAHLPIRMLHDRVLLKHDDSDGERQTGGALLIHATAGLGTWLT